MKTTKYLLRFACCLAVAALIFSCSSERDFPTSDASENIEEAPSNNSKENEGQESTTTPIESPRELDVADENVSIREVVSYFSLHRYGVTQKIYHLKNKNAAIIIWIDNKSTDFEPRVTIYLFDVDVSEQSIGSWINNQYSDGIYPDAPEPLSSYKLAEDYYSVTSYSFIGQEVGEHGDEYDSYSLEIFVDNVSEVDAFYLLSFVAETVVHVQTKGIPGL